MKFDARVSSDWRVTIPANIRKRLNWQPKDTITFTLKPDGTLILRAEGKRFPDFVAPSHKEAPP